MTQNGKTKSRIQRRTSTFPRWGVRAKLVRHSSGVLTKHILGLPPYIIISSCNAQGQHGVSAHCDKFGLVKAITIQTLLIPDSPRKYRLKIFRRDDGCKHQWNNTCNCVSKSVQSEARLYDSLFSDIHPDASSKFLIEAPNPDSLNIVTAFVEFSLALA